MVSCLRLHSPSACRPCSTGGCESSGLGDGLFSTDGHLGQFTQSHSLFQDLEC